MSVHLYAASEFQYTWRRKCEFTTTKVIMYSTGICISPSCLKGLDSDPSQLVFYRLLTSIPEKTFSVRRDAKQKRDFYCKTYRTSGESHDAFEVVGFTCEVISLGSGCVTYRKLLCATSEIDSVTFQS
jgi:hypothetical protein